MLTIKGKLTGVSTKLNNKNETVYYANLLSEDGSKLVNVRIKADKYAELAQKIDKVVEIPVYVNAYNNVAYFNQV